MKKTDANSLLKGAWFDTLDVPDFFSFRCLIKFKEFGIEGPERNHVSTGYWSHKASMFRVDNPEMRHMTPVEYIPIYEQID